jgi:DNA-binding beta-propeller fold protein YncE
MCFDASGNLYVAETGSHRVVVVNAATRVVATVAGLPGSSGSANGAGTNARFQGPSSLVVDLSGQFLYVVDAGNHCIRQVVLATSQVSTLAGNCGNSGFANGTGTQALFNNPVLIVASASGILYVSDSSNNRVRIISLPVGGGSAVVSSINAIFLGPKGLALDSAGSSIFVVEIGLTLVSRYVFGTGAYAVVAGSSTASGYVDGVGLAARFSKEIKQMFLDSDRFLYLAENRNSTPVVRVIDVLSGAVFTAAGNGVAGVSFSNLWGLAVSAGSDRALYVSDSAANTVQMIALPVSPCAKGYFCPAGSSVATVCALGFYCPSPLMQIPCPAGTACNVKGLTNVSSAVPCAPMTFSAAGSSTCSKCPVNAYSLGSASTCVSCGECTGMLCTLYHRYLLGHVNASNSPDLYFLLASTFFFLTVAPVLQAPQQIGLCDALTLDGSASIGGFGFPLAATWSLLEPTNLPADQKKVLADFLAKASAPATPSDFFSTKGGNYGQLLVTIPSSMLKNFTKTSIFRLKLVNAFGRSASASVFVSKSALPLFPIFLSGPAVQSVRRASSVAQHASTDYTLAASTVCGATVARMSVQFTWRQLQSSGEAATAMGATMTASAALTSMAVANETIGVDLSRAALTIPARTLRVGFVYGVCLCSDAPALRSLHLCFGSLCVFSWYSTMFPWVFLLQVQSFKWR